MIRYVLDKDIKYIYPRGSDFPNEDRIVIPRHYDRDIYVDLISNNSGIYLVKLYLSDGNVLEGLLPQSRYMSCFRLKDCSDKTNYSKVGLPLVPDVLFDGRFNS